MCKLILLSLLALAAYADTTYYVDTDTGSGSTCTSSTPCAHLSTAIALITGTLTQNYTIIVQGTAADTAVTFSGWTPGSHTVTVQGSGNSTGRHAGVWSTSKYRIDGGSSTPISINGSNVTLIGIQLTGTAVLINTSSSTTGTLIDGLLLNGGTYGVYNNGSATVRNSISWRSGNAGFANALSTSVLTLQNDTEGSGTAYGVRNFNAGTLTATNVYSTHHSGSAAYIGTMSLTNCASDDGSEGTTTVAYSTTAGAYFTNITSGSEDFHINSGSALIGAGADLSTTFTDDIDGRTRTVPFSIGADQIVASPPTVTCPSATTGIVGQSYSSSAGASGGAGAPYSNFAGASGSLPTGLTITSSTGVVAGTPSTTSGSPFSFTISAQDSAATTGTSSTCTLTISGPSPAKRRRIM